MVQNRLRANETIVKKSAIKVKNDEEAEQKCKQGEVIKNITSITAKKARSIHPGFLKILQS